jgi:hypothetical protein
MISIYSGNLHCRQRGVQRFLLFKLKLSIAKQGYHQLCVTLQMADYDSSSVVPPGVNDSSSAVPPGINHSTS